MQRAKLSRPSADLPTASPAILDNASSTSPPAGPSLVNHSFGAITVAPERGPDDHHHEPGAEPTAVNIGRPDDPQEKEADRAAELIMHKPAPESSPALTSVGDEVVQRATAEPQPGHEENPEKEREEQEEEGRERPPEGQSARRKETDRSPIAAPPRALAPTHGDGAPLDPATRRFMEPRFGHDFGQIRIHSDSQSAEAARSIHARAYTLGPHIVFGSGQYAPETEDGRRLLAHELAHVVQQGSAPAAGPVIRRSPDGSPTPAPAPGVTPPSPPPPGAPAPAPAPANKETDTGLIYVTIERLTVMDKKSKTIRPFEWSTEVPLVKIPIPDFGAASLTFRASFGTELTGEIGPIVFTNLTLGMTKMTALALGAGALFAGVTAPMLGPMAVGPLLTAAKLGYITGFGQLYAPGKISAGVKANASLDAVLSLLGTEKLDVARTGFGVEGSLHAELSGAAMGRTQVTLDDGHLRWKSLAVLSAAAGFDVNLKAYLHASILFGLLKARLDKQWSIGTRWGAALRQPIGDLSLDYDWPGFKDEDKVITVREETIKGVMNFVEDLLKKDKDPGKVTDKEDLKDKEAAGPDNRTPEQKLAALDKAIADSDIELTKPKATPLDVKSKLPGIQRANRLTSLDLVTAEPNKYYVEGVINPVRVTPTRPLTPSPTHYPTGEDPNTRTITQLWKDCSPNTVFIGEAPADTPVRVELAEATLATKVRNSAQMTAILGHDHGQSPRPFSSVVAEDALGLGGHTTDRHVFGMGTVTDVEALAMRVLRSVPAPCPGKAGAFDSLRDADAAVSAGLKGGMSGSAWEDIRMKLALGETVVLTPGLSSRGTALTGRRVPVAQLPRYKGGTASVQLYPGDPKVPHPAITTPLTEYEKCTETYLRVVANPRAPGGWYINSAWPQ